MIVCLLLFNALIFLILMVVMLGLFDNWKWGPRLVWPAQAEPRNESQAGTGAISATGPSKNSHILRLPGYGSEKYNQMLLKVLAKHGRHFLRSLLRGCLISHHQKWGSFLEMLSAHLKIHVDAMVINFPVSKDLSF